MRVLVQNRCIRPRLLHLRSVRGWQAHFEHVRCLSLRPNYLFRPLKFQNYES